MTELDPDNVIAVEFDHEMRPFSIWTRDRWNNRPEDDRAEQWDIEFCKGEGQFYYHNSGSGPIYNKRHNSPSYGISPARDFWVEAGLPFQAHGTLTYHVRWSGLFLAMHMVLKYPPPIQLLSLPDGFDLTKFIEDASESEVTFCPECDDWLPEDSDSLCEHMSWCNDCGEYTPDLKLWRFTPGEYWYGFVWINRCAQCRLPRQWEDEDDN